MSWKEGSVGVPQQPPDSGVAGAAPDTDQAPTGATHGSEAFRTMPSVANGSTSSSSSSSQEAHSGGESSNQSKNKEVTAFPHVNTDKLRVIVDTKSGTVAEELESEKVPATKGDSFFHTSIKSLEKTNYDDSTKDSQEDDKPRRLSVDNATISSVDKPEEPMPHTLCFPLVNHSWDKGPPPHTAAEADPPPHTAAEADPPPQLMPTKDTQPVPELVGFKPKNKPKKQRGLTTARDGKDSDSSSVSSKRRLSKSKAKIKSKFAPGSLEYIEDRLCGRIFSGWVEERKWVESVGGYRDVIEVDEWEKEMNAQLEAIITSIPGVKEGRKWINITPPSDSLYYSLWVLLPAPPTPGHYWYTVTGVQLQPHFGLMITVKEIRSIHPYDGELAAARRKRYKKKLLGSPRNELESVSDLLQDWTEQLSHLRPATILSALTSVLSLRNIKEAIRFIIVLLATLVIGLATLVRESHLFGLRLVREAGIFFHNATPFMQTLLGFVEKIIGGMYLLVAMVYRDLRRPSFPPPPQAHYPPLPPPDPPTSPTDTPRPRAIQYVSPDRWVVRNQNH